MRRGLWTFPLRTLVAGLVLCAGLVSAVPADAYYILARVEPDGAGIFGPTDVAGQGLGSEKEVSISHNQGFPPNASELAATARVNLLNGTVRGSAHVASSHPQQHTIRFSALLEEQLQINFPFSLPVEERIVIVKAGFHAGWGYTDLADASARGVFQLIANSKLLGVGYGTDEPGSGYNPKFAPDPNVTGELASGGYNITYRVPFTGTSRALNLSLSLDGTVFARGRLNDPNSADINAMNTGTIQLVLPAGTTFSSTSGVFLSQPIPEPGTATLLAAGLAGLAVRRRRAVRR